MTLQVTHDGEGSFFLMDGKERVMIESSPDWKKKHEQASETVGWISIVSDPNP